MENCKETIKFYNGLFLLLFFGFLVMFFMYVREYNKNHEQDSYWSKQYDSLINYNRTNIIDTLKSK